MTALHKPEASREPSPVIDKEELEHDATRSQSEAPEQPPLIEIEEPVFNSPVERIRRITTPSPTYRQPIEMSLNFYLRCSRFVEQLLCRRVNSKKALTTAGTANAGTSSETAGCSYDELWAHVWWSSEGSCGGCRSKVATGS
jgi:hypothetical protein